MSDSPASEVPEKSKTPVSVAETSLEGIAEAAPDPTSSESGASGDTPSQDETFETYADGLPLPKSEAVEPG